MNNDGITDLVVGARVDQTIVVLLGNGTLSAGGMQNACGWAWKLVTGDVNGDHNADVAVVNGVILKDKAD